MRGEVSIIGGGWSVRDVDLRDVPGLVIGVNDAALLAPRCDIAVSMDRLWTEARWGDLRERGRRAWIRAAALKNIPSRPRWLTPFLCDHTSSVFADEPGELNGTNSGFCALNLAWKLRPHRLVLFGFDMKRGPDGAAYWYPSYPWARPQGGTGDGRYSEWAGQFAIAAKAFAAAGVEVINASPGSAIEAFAKRSPAELGCAAGRSGAGVAR